MWEISSSKHNSTQTHNVTHRYFSVAIRTRTETRALRSCFENEFFRTSKICARAKEITSIVASKSKEFEELQIMSDLHHVSVLEAANGYIILVLGKR